jgi:hypothetical protein
VELVDARPNVMDKRLDLTGKLDFKINDAIDMTVGGSYYNTSNHFSPNREWNLLNWQHNPYEQSDGYVFNAGSAIVSGEHRLHRRMPIMLNP